MPPFVIVAIIIAIRESLLLLGVNGAAAEGACACLSSTPVPLRSRLPVLGGAALAAFLMFANKTYSALIKWWKSKEVAPSPSVPPASPTSAQRARGGGTHPTASLPRFAHNLSVAMHLPLPKPSTQHGRPMSTLRAYPTGMGPSHIRRGSEASMNSTVDLLRVPAPPARAPAPPKPAFLGRGTATGQRMTR